MVLPSVTMGKNITKSSSNVCEAFSHDDNKIPKLKLKFVLPDINL